MNKKIIIVLIGLLVLGIFGFFGYKYINKTEQDYNEMNLNTKPGDESMEEVPASKPESKMIETVKTNDDEIDKELENMDQELDLELEELE